MHHFGFTVPILQGGVQTIGAHIQHVIVCQIKYIKPQSNHLISQRLRRIEERIAGRRVNAVHHRLLIDGGYVRLSNSVRYIGVGGGKVVVIPSPGPVVGLIINGRVDEIVPHRNKTDAYRIRRGRLAFFGKGGFRLGIGRIGGRGTAGQGNQHHPRHKAGPILWENENDS